MLFTIFPHAFVDVSVSHVENSAAIFVIVQPVAVVDGPVGMEHFAVTVTLIAFPLAFIVRIAIVAKLWAVKGVKWIYKVLTRSNECPGHVSCQ